MGIGGAGNTDAIRADGGFGVGAFGIGDTAGALSVKTEGSLGADLRALLVFGAGESNTSTSG